MVAADDAALARPTDQGGRGQGRGERCWVFEGARPADIRRRSSAAGAFVARRVLGYRAVMTANSMPVPHGRICVDPAVMMGKPCVKGTRITVELILRKLGAGRSFAELLEAYPRLTEEDLKAALAFAADYLQHETVLAAT